MKPTIGRIVCYNTTGDDQRRMETNPLCNIQDKLPAIIVAVWDDTEDTTCVNLHVILDGEGDLWVTSRYKGDGYGQWNWFPKV